LSHRKYLQASIFSTIVTTCVTQTYQSLQQTPQVEVVTAALLAELVAIQRAAANGSSVNDVPLSPALTMSPFTPSSSDVWVNALWFTSLMLSLWTAFLGVFAKQWLYQYMATTSGSPRARALVRQARNLGLHEWYVPMFISILPVVLHISLALFFGGLVILLRSILPSLACFIASVVGTVYVAYFISNVLPVFYPRCPYRTGLTPMLYQLYSSFPSIILKITEPPHEYSMDHISWQIWQRWSRWNCIQRIAVKLTWPAKLTSWREVENAASTDTNGFLEAKSIYWLYSSSYNPSAVQIALAALAGLSSHQVRFMECWDGDISMLEKHLRSQCIYPSECDPSSFKTEQQLELHLRALVQIHPLSVSNPIQYEQPYLPGFPDLDFWKQKKTNAHLHTLLTCGWFKEPYQVGNPSNSSHSTDFFSILFPKECPSNTVLPARVWIMILKAFRQSIITRKLYDAHIFMWIVHFLTIAKDANFFRGRCPLLAMTALDQTVVVTTIHVPTSTMCLAMLECLRPPLHNCIEPGPLCAYPLVGSVPRILLEILLWLGSRHAASENSSHLAAVNLLLDCLLQSTKQMNDGDNFEGVFSIWSPESKKAANDALLLFLKTNLFFMCTSTATVETQQIARKTFAFIETLFLPGCPWAPVLRFQDFTETIFRTYFNTIGAFDDYAFEISHEASRWKRGGIALLCSAFDRHDECAYKGMIAANAIPALYDLWLKECRRMVMNSHPTAVEFIQHYLDGVLLNVEWTSSQLQYIHQPDNLYYLCLVLLIEDHSHRTLMKLLCIEPQHSAWAGCLTRLRQWRPLAENSISGYRPSVIKRVYDGIADMQNILGISEEIQLYCDPEEPWKLGRQERDTDIRSGGREFREEDRVRFGLIFLCLELTVGVLASRLISQPCKGT